MNKDVFRKLRQMLMEELDLSRELSDKEILDVIDELILNQIKDVRLALKEKVQLRQELFYSVRKLDVLQELVDDETVTEIMVNGPDTIFVERAGKLMKWHKSFTSAEKLEDVIQQIVGKCNRVINESMPIVDARLENGSRVNAVIYCFFVCSCTIIQISIKVIKSFLILSQIKWIVLQIFPHLSANYNLVINWIVKNNGAILATVLFTNKITCFFVF